MYPRPDLRYYTDVVESHVGLSGKDPLGNVCDGYLVLRGALRNMSGLAEFDISEYMSVNWDVGYDLDRSQAKARFRLGIWMLCIKERAWLMLAQQDQTCNTSGNKVFKRCGMTRC
jgi:hypothetical protein